jgi:formylglycine-generating enzyme required for sulfatase activity
MGSSLSFGQGWYSAVNPNSPDTIKLTAKIRDLLLKKQEDEVGQKMADFASYEGLLTKAKQPQKFAMVAIKAGEFLMGSPATEPNRHEDEGPQVKVRIDAFWMGATEVTWDLYKPFMDTAEPRWKDGSRKESLPDAAPVDAVSRPTAPYTDMTWSMGEEGYPAICMTEHAANKFCQWLSAQTGHYYRLPTEAEWEYAARAGTTTAYSFGDDPKKLADYAWCWENSDGTTQPVGKKLPNPWGLYDMHGNVVEWVLDQYQSDFYPSLSASATGAPVSNPFNKPVTLYPRVVRGGSWDDDAPALRSACRRGSRDVWKIMDPQLPKSYWFHTSAQFLGFRIVRPLRIPSLEEMHHAWNCGFVVNK